MSTRATYRFKAADQQPAQCFYIHHDGYPQGAADYFKAMLACENDRSGLAGKFFRGNELAEFTESHEIHGDTDYRYDLHRYSGQAFVKCWKRNRTGEGSWSVLWDGAADEFIDCFTPS